VAEARAQAGQPDVAQALIEQCLDGLRRGTGYYRRDLIEVAAALLSAGWYRDAILLAPLFGEWEQDYLCGLALNLGKCALEAGQRMAVEQAVGPWLHLWGSSQGASVAACGLLAELFPDQAGELGELLGGPERPKWLPTPIG
jgi:hypothetical protein